MLHFPFQESVQHEPSTSRASQSISQNVMNLAGVGKANFNFSRTSSREADEHVDKK